MDFYLDPFGSFSSKLYVLSTCWFYWFCHSILGLSAPEQGVYVRKLRALSQPTEKVQGPYLACSIWIGPFILFMCMMLYMFVLMQCSCRGSRHRWTVWNVMAQVTGTSDNTMYTLWKLVINSDNVTFVDFLKLDWSLALYTVHIYVWPWLALKII